MAAGTSQAGGEDGPLAKLRDIAAKNPATEQLMDAGQRYLQAKTQDVVSQAGTKLGEASKRLSETADGGGTLGSLVGAGSKLAEGKSPGRTAVEMGGRAIKDKLKGLFGGGKGGSSGGTKVINIVEDIDVGVPVRVAFDQWTEFQDFSSFSKGVVSAERTDEVSSNWKFKIFWSNRSMRATVTEQVPDERIAWNAEGAKGTVKGVVTFHPLGENLTKILLVLEYYPVGFFEKTGNIWRAQGRRARLDLKHYRRFISMQGEPSGEGWRGEIRDGEVVRSHEDVLAEDGEESEQSAGEDDEQEPEEDYADEYDEDEDDEGEDNDGDEEDEEADYEDDYEDTEENPEDEYEDEGEDEYADESEQDRPARRRRAGAR